MSTKFKIKGSSNKVEEIKERQMEIIELKNTITEIFKDIQCIESKADGKYRGSN